MSSLWDWFFRCRRVNVVVVVYPKVDIVLFHPCSFEIPNELVVRASKSFL